MAAHASRCRPPLSPPVPTAVRARNCPAHPARERRCGRRPVSAQRACRTQGWMAGKRAAPQKRKQPPAVEATDRIFSLVRAGSLRGAHAPTVCVLQSCLLATGLPAFSLCLLSHALCPPISLTHTPHTQSSLTSRAEAERQLRNPRGSPSPRASPRGEPREGAQGDDDDDAAAEGPRRSRQRL